MDTQTIYRRRWGILSVLIVSLLAIVIDNTVLNVALKTIADPHGGLGASQSQLEWAINSYTLVFAGLLFTFGVIGDRIGRKRMLMIGLVLFGIGSLLSAYSRSPDQLILARAAMGLGGAAVMPQRCRSSPTSSSRRSGRGPSASGPPRSASASRSAPCSAACCWPTSGGARSSSSTCPSRWPARCRRPAGSGVAEPERYGIDLPGVLLSIAGLVLLVYGIVQGGDAGSWVHLNVLGPIIGGLAVLALFAWHESRARHPALDVRLFRDRRLSASVGAIGLVFFGMGGVYFFTSFYTQNVLGYSPVGAGLLTVPFAVGQLLLSPRSASLVRRFGAKAAGAGGMLVMSAALAGYVLLGTASPAWLLGLLFFVQGAGIGVTMPAATSAVMDVLPRERAGAGSALTNTARQVGVALGVAVLGSILAQSYHQALSPKLAALPAAARGAAGGSIAGTQAVAAQLGAAGRFLLGPANDAFVSAMHVTTIVAAVIALAGAIVVLCWMPGLSAAPAVAQEITEPDATDAPEHSVPERAILQPVALEAAAAPRIDPAEAVDVWQENLSAWTGQPAASRPWTGQPAAPGPDSLRPVGPGPDSLRPVGPGPDSPRPASLGPDSVSAAGPGPPPRSRRTRRTRRTRPTRRTRWMSTSSTCGQETSPISHTAWKDRN